MQKAEAATKAGHSARAIRLLGRVLELEKDQKQARTMLSRLRTRERTVRRLMVGGASVIGTALLSGGAVLLYMVPPTAENLPREDRTPEGTAVPRAKVAPDKRSPATNTAVETPPAPEPATRKGTTTTVGKPPVKAVAADARCSLKVIGMPVPVVGAGGHNLRIGSETGRALKESVVPLTFTGESTQVQLTGSMYTGLLTIGRRQCVPGAVIELTANAKPARLRFIDDPPNTTVRCKSGPPCPDALFHLLSAEDFPAIPVDEIDTPIELEIKAEGYQGKTERLRIHPGVNQVNINLTKNTQR